MGKVFSVLAAAEGVQRDGDSHTQAWSAVREREGDRHSADDTAGGFMLPSTGGYLEVNGTDQIY